MGFSPKNHLVKYGAPTMTIYIYISTLLLHYISYFNPKRWLTCLLMHPIISKDYPEKKINENAQTYHVEVAILM